MDEIYEFEGQVYHVAPEKLEKFKLEFPDAVKTGTVDLTPPAPAEGFESLFVEESQTAPNKYDHVSQEDFVNLSTSRELEASENWFTDTFGKKVQKRHDRENHIKTLYEKKYAGTGIKFNTKILDGNSMEVVLPGSDKGRPFKLSDDPAEAAATYVDITEYIENKTNYSVGDNTVSEIENIFEFGDLSKIQKRHYNPELYDRMSSENIQKALGSDYTVTDSGFFNQSFVIEAPGGGKQTFTKTATTSKQILNFIKRNPRSIEQTKKFKEEEANFIKKAKTDIEQVLKARVNAQYGSASYDKEEMLTMLLDPAFRTKIEKEILATVNITGFSKMISADGTETPKNLTNEHIDEISSNIVQEALDRHIENVTQEHASSEHAKEKSKGRSDSEIKHTQFLNHIAGMDEYETQQAILWNKINNPKLESEKQKNITDYNTAVALYDEKFPDKPFVYNYDVSTGKRALVIDEKNTDIVNLSPLITKQIAKYENLDHSTLDQELFTVTLAQNSAKREFKTKKDRYKVTNYNKEVKYLTDKQSELFFDAQKKGLNAKGKTVRVGKPDFYFQATGEEAVGLGLKDPLLSSQQQYLTDLEIRKQALIQLQVLNKKSSTIGRSGFGEVFGETLLNSFGLGSENHVSDSKLVSAMNQELENEGVTLTMAEKNLYNVTDSEALGETLGGLPRLIVDFAIANKVAAGIQTAVGIGRLYTVLNAKRYYKVAKNGRKVFVKTPTTNPYLKANIMGSSEKRIANWAKNKGLKSTAPVFWKRAASTTLTGVIEGVKMEAVLGPGSFSTGVGFGMAGKIIPWGVIRGSNWGKTMFDYGVKSPINFTIGAEAGEIMNGLSNDMMNKKDFGDFMHEHYSDYSAAKQRTIANLVAGFAMRFSHISKFDFKSNKQIRNLQTEAQQKINKAYGLYTKESGKKPKTFKQRFKGEGGPSNKRLRKFEDIIEREGVLVDLAKRRLHEINNTEMYLDPVLGPQKVANDLKNNTQLLIKELGKKNIEVNDVKVEFTDAKAKGSYIYDKKSKNIIFTVNPKYIQPGLAAHEVGHGGVEMLAGQDAMFKAEFVKAIDAVSEKIKMDDGRTLFETMKGLKGETATGEAMFGGSVLAKYDVNRVVINEKLQYLAEAMANPQIADQIRKEYGFDMYSNMLKKFMKENLNADTNFNTEKEVAEWMDGYITSIEKGVGIGKSFKHLENWISIEATNTQMEARKTYEKANFIIRETSMKSEVFDKVKAEKEVADITEKIKKAAEDYNSKKISKEQFEKLDVKSLVAEKNRISELIKSSGKTKTDFENIVSEIYDSKTLSKTDKAFYISELWDPRGYIDPATGKRVRWSRNDKESDLFEKTDGEQGFKKKPGGAIALERALNKHQNVDGFELKYDDIVDDIVSGFGKESKKGKGLNKARSVRQLVMDFSPVDHPGVEIPGYINSILLSGNKRYLEHVQYHLKESKIGFKTSFDKTKDITGDANLKTYTASEKDISQYGDTKVIFELPVNQEAFNRPKGWKSTIEKNYDPLKNTSLKTTPDLAPKFTREMMGVKLTEAQAKRTNDLGEKNLKAIQDFIEAEFKTEQETVNEKTAEKEVRKISMVDTFRKILNEGAVSFEQGVRDALVGSSTGNRQLILDAFYHEATQKELVGLGFKISKETGRVKTAAGQKPMVLNKNITDAQILEFVGIKDGKRTKISQDRSLAGKGRAVLEVFGEGVTQQTLRLGDKLTANQMFDMGAGRNRALMSELLAGQDFVNQRLFLDIVQSKGFANLLERNKKKYPKNQQEALERTLIDHFAIQKGTNFKNKTLRTIAKELSKEFANTTIDAAKVSVAAAKQIVYTNILDNISSAKHRLETDVDIAEAKAVTRIVMKSIIEKHGDGIYELLFASGESSGTGVGSFPSWGDLMAGTNKGKNWKSLHEVREKAIEFMSDIKNSKGEKFTKFKKALLEGQGDKAGQMNRFINKKTGEWDMKKIEEAYEVGEFVKSVLKDAVEVLRKSRESGDITESQARQWVEIHAGPMTGVVRLSASFAIMPNMSPKEMFKLHPERVKDPKTGKMVSNWVLEHTTPAQYVKARMFDYIINGGEARKTALDLTLRDYHTTLIPKSLDTMINKILKTNLPSTHLPGMDVMERYYEASHSSDFDFGLKAFAGHRKGKVYDKNITLSQVEKQRRSKELRKSLDALLPSIVKVSKTKLNSEVLNDMKDIDKALKLGRSKNKKSRGMSTFDFDETVGVSENFVYAKKGNKTKKISSAKWAEVGDKLLNEGWKMDFTDFNKVTKGKPGPLMQKLKNQIEKFGPENVFILTARAPESAKAIHEWLKNEGVDISLKNITGLGESTGEAKALWMLKKFAEGYNDMYFVDDALPNVKAVREVLNQLDIKSKVQIARQMNSEILSEEINNIMEYSFGIESKKRFSKAEGKMRGKDKKRRKFFIPDSAADLELLIEPLYGKGKKGTENKKWIEKEFLKPWERGVNDLNNARQAIANDYMSLRKQNKDVVKLLDKVIEGTNFTNDAAMRVYIWNKSGLKIPGLTKTSQKKLIEHVQSNPKLQSFAERVAQLTKIETGLKQPTENWWAETIASEISETGRTVNREKYIGDWIERKNEIFSEANLSKMESELGPKWRESMDDMLYRMESGRTRRRDLGRIGNNVMDYLNGSVGTIMSLNTRSATLQLISTVNFINHAENNPLAAARAFANQPQYWKDFMHIMNSDMLRQRRDGLKINVTEAELAAAVHGKGSKAKRALAWILKQGYIPTKIADSFAIASGGATYYRNRIRMYEKEGFSAKEAESKAWVDFQAIAERTQQSSRADLLSKQQVSFEGRLILPFANTPMQMNRIMMKEVLDISKGRFKGWVGENSFTNKISKISYYGFIQSAIFAGLQSGAFALMANSDDDELIAQKKLNAINTTCDSFLRGMGITGAVAAGFKNAVLAFIKQDEKGFFGDFGEVPESLLNISPTIGSKFSKMDGSGNTYKYNQKEIKEKGLDIENTSAIEASAQTIEAVFNVPVGRVFKKTSNIKAALDDQNEAWQRFMLIMGWSKYDVGIKRPEKPEKPKRRKVKKIIF